MPVKLTIAIATLLAALGLAACGSDETVGGASEEEVVVAESGPVEGELTVSNWPGYIDPGKNGSVAEFEEQTGATVKYIEDINSNLQFFGKMQPLLDQGESGGRDIIVVTDWMAKRMYDLGYLEEINPDDVPTVLDNLAPQFQSEGSYDPEHKFSIPWQGGMTGLWIIKGEADRRYVGQRPSRGSQVQGARDRPGRDARHRAAGDEGRRRRHGECHQGGLDGSDRQDRRRPSSRGRSER